MLLTLALTLVLLFTIRELQKTQNKVSRLEYELTGFISTNATVSTNYRKFIEKLDRVDLKIKEIEIRCDGLSSAAEGESVKKPTKRRRTKKTEENSTS